MLHSNKMSHTGKFKYNYYKDYIKPFVSYTVRYSRLNYSLTLRNRLELFDA